ncbi:dirigent protein 1-like [Triticum dicoccoides]|uniref:dirigent protein 1-like n=1 Tax=Triticum dicoccoides TaxID=85692 RepID=UPI001890A523|nr:dirigent protein 1-like [Triticum dicoccoides]
MASLSSLFLASAFLLAGSAFFYRYDAGSGNKTSGTTTTHLHFYMHDDYTGPRPTAMRVVSGRAVSTGDNATALKTAPRHFGDIVVLNNALTVGPSGGSARVGTAQGWTVRVSEGGIVSDLTLHLVLEAGEHHGSSLTARGRIDMDATVRESVLIGGTGRFRYARGYMLTKNYDYSLATGGVVEIDVYVQHD